MRSKKSEICELELWQSPRPIVTTGKVSPYSEGEAWTAKHPAKKRSHGQVFTPEKIALPMAKWATHKKPISVLDPAVGFGALLAACKNNQPSIQCVGFDIDEDLIVKAKNTMPNGSHLYNIDFLSCGDSNFQSIIANPPYIKYEYLNMLTSRWVELDKEFGFRLNRQSNIYVMFIMKIWNALSDNGVASIIVPTEFLNANYGHEIREALIKIIRPVGIVIFDTTELVFNDALTTSCLLFLSKDNNPNRKSIVTAVKSIEELKTTVDHLVSGELSNIENSIEIEQLGSSGKWINQINALKNEQKAVTLKRKVGDYFRCKRGIATGANSYFCLCKSEIQNFNLKVSDFKKCITKANDLTSGLFSESDFTSLVNEGKKCFLLSPEIISPRLKEYINLGISQEVHLRHLPAHRNPWYSHEKRDPAQILVGVFTRDYPKYVLNDAGILNLTCFHGLYDGEGDSGRKYAMLLFLLSAEGHEAFSTVNRFYGGGLNKLEPKDVEAIPCPDIPTLGKATIMSIKRFLESIKNLSPDSISGACSGEFAKLRKKSNC